MIVYAICMLVFALLEVVTGIMIYRGDYGVIYDYYISEVNDLKGYTKAVGIATVCLAVPSLACGVLLLFPSPMPFALIGAGVAVVGGLIGYAVFYAIQSKYNGGMF